MNNKSGIDFNTGIYIRLSQEDKDKKYESDSESVINQRELLTNYVKNNNFNLVGEYVDDGYSGTDFERPGFQKLIEDIKNKKINCVIVKDLSRLGRDHVMTGYYMESYFPENNIRFISILESFDSFKNQASNDSSTFIIACNDYYSKQNSIKIRNVLNEKRKNGKFVGSLPCFGYMRDPEDKGHLIPNLETAPIVKQIFEWRKSGIGPSRIATMLNEKGYPTPSGYKKTNYSSRLINRDKWNISSIKKILSNRIYTGDMIQHTQTKVNYKSKKKITLDQSMWMIVENTHEPLVDKDTFEYISKLIKQNTKDVQPKNRREKRLLEGKLFCKECGNRLSVLYRKNHDYWTVNCNRYARDPIREQCSSHFFPYNYLEDQIMERFTKDVSRQLEVLDFEELNKKVQIEVQKQTKNLDNNINNLLIEKDKITKRLTALYEDRYNEVITADTYKELAKPFEEKLKLINQSIDEDQIRKYEVKSKLNELPDYAKKIKKLLDLNKPKKELVHSLIDRIVIDDNRVITIQYKYGVIPDCTFEYQNLNIARNPYGRKGKNQYSK